MKYKDIPYTDLKSVDDRIIFKFRNLDDLLLNVMYRNDRKVFHAHPHLRSSRETSEYKDTNNFEEALEKVKGKPILPEELGYKIKKLLKKNNISIQEAPENMIGLDIPSFLGKQDYFVNVSKKVKVAKKIKTDYVYLNLGIDWTISAEELAEKTKKTLLYIYENYTFKKVIIVYPSLIPFSSKHINYYSLILLEISNKNIKDFFRIMFGDFFRRIIFYLYEQSSVLRGGYGYPLEQRKDLKLLENQIFYNIYDF